MITQSPKNYQQLKNTQLYQKRYSIQGTTSPKHIIYNSSQQKQIMAPVKEQNVTQLQQMKKRLNSLLIKTQFVINKQKINEKSPHTTKLQIHTNQQNKNQQQYLKKHRPTSLQQINSQPNNKIERHPETMNNVQNNFNRHQNHFTSNRKVNIVYQKQQHVPQNDKTDNGKIKPLSISPQVIQKTKNQIIQRKVQTHQTGLKFTPRRQYQSPIVTIKNQVPITKSKLHQNPQKIVKLVQSVTQIQKKLSTSQNIQIKPQKQTINLQNKGKLKGLIEYQKNVSERQEKQNEISWTKFIALQLKNQSLQRTIKQSQMRFNEKSQINKKNILQKQQTIKHLSRKHYQTKKDYQEKISNMTIQFEDKLKQKNAHIKKLVEELSGLSLKEKDKVFKDKILQVMKDDEEIKIKITQSQNKVFQLEGIIRMKNQQLQDIQSQNLILQKDNQLLIEEKQRRESGLSFDQNIKVQFDSFNQLKQKIQFLQDENYKIKENLRNTQHQLELVQNEKRINEVKESSIRNRLTTEMGIKLTQKQNKIQSLQKKMITMSEKYKVAIRQIKEKDQFLQNYLKGRTDDISVKEHIQQVLEKYAEKLREGGESEIAQLQKKIENLNLKLKYYDQNW